MAFNPHFYPQFHAIIPMATVRRERRLIRGAILENHAAPGAPVDSDNAVVRGLLPGGVHLIDVRAALKLRPAAAVTDDMLDVIPGQKILIGDNLLTVKQGRRSRSVKSPIDGLFARLEGDDLVLWIDPVPIDVAALYPGRVVATYPERAAVLIETSGAVVTAAWGNGKTAYSQIRLEPNEGFESLQADLLLPEYRGVAVVTRKPIPDASYFTIAVQQEMTALIAPSMPAALIQAAEALEIPVVLTEGFGLIPMSEVAFAPFRDHQGRPAAINGANPLRERDAQPEVIITTPGGIMNAPKYDQALKADSTVRIGRDPFGGQTGTIRRLFDSPQQLENSVHARAAEVILASGRVIIVPLVNLELLGRE